MKKFIGFLTLIGFLVASNMQLVHAVSMTNDMSSHHGGVQKEDNTFCDKSNNSDKNECNVDLIGDKYISNIKSKLELNDNITILPFYFEYKATTIYLKSNLQINSPPTDIFQKSSYSNLLRIVKSLN